MNKSFLDRKAILSTNSGDISDTGSREMATWLLASIVESSEDAIISKDLTGTILSWNQAATRIFGYTEAEAIGRPITMLIPEDLQDQELDILDRIRRGESIKHFETIRRMKTGQLIPISLTVSPVKDRTGKIIGASKIARDNSEKVRAQQQLQEYAARLKEMNGYKDEFIGIAGHELRTPLTTIKAYLQLLTATELSSEGRFYLDKTLRQAEKLNKLIEELLNVSRIQAGKLTLSLSRFLLKDLLNDCIDAAKYSHSAHRIICESAIDGEYIVADRQRLEQVVTNLLSNAIKYSPGNSTIIIRAWAEEGWVLVEVQDFGIGIPPDQADRIFERFFRVQGAGNHFQGLGLGLYISHEIISLHQGKLWVQSAPGQGSSFFFRIPTTLSVSAPEGSLSAETAGPFQESVRPEGRV